MSELVIQVANGGLGDHLFHSHLPRIAKLTRAYSRVLYSTASPTRQQAVVDLVWRSNPYIDGFTDRPGRVLPPNLEVVIPGNLLDAVMLNFGLDDGTRNHEPELFCDFATDPRLSAASVYDPNYVSFVGAVDKDFVTEYLNRNCTRPLYQLKPTRTSCDSEHYLPQLVAENLEHYCRIILSCKAFFCLTSGSATLAAALGKPSVAFFGYGQDPVFHHSKLHQYVLASHPGFTTRIRAMLLRARRRIRCA